MADTDIRTLTSPEDIRGYFVQFSAILRALTLISKKEQDTAVRDAWENTIVLDYLKRLSATLHALGLKYGFAGYLGDRLPSDFEIDVRDSGFPSVTEIRRLENDLAEARAMAEKDVRVDLRADMVDYILTHKRAPRDLQFRQAQSRYHQTLRTDALFTTRLEPTIVALDDAPKGFRRVLVHWAVYDGERNHPVIYIMVADESGPRPLTDDAERADALRRSCLGLSQMSLLPLTIATKIDEEFLDLHPKSFKRVVVGPMYSSRFTEVSEGVGAALAPFSGDYRMDWIFQWTVESLRSKGSKRQRTGMFGERFIEVFDIDTKNPQSIKTGTTEVMSRVVMPYDVFQMLQHHPDNPLNDVPKYVIDANGHIGMHL